MMNNFDRKEIESMIDRAAVQAAERTLKHLKDAGRVKHYFSNSFRKTEEVLYLYPNLPEENEMKQKIDIALSKISSYDYCDIVASKYFDGLTLEEISEIYDCKQQTISQRRTKLVKIIASELFPEEVLQEILKK